MSIDPSSVQTTDQSTDPTTDRNGDLAAAAASTGADLNGKAAQDAARQIRERLAGFTDIALVQVGGDTQDAFFKEAAAPLLDKLRSAAQ